MGRSKDEIQQELENSLSSNLWQTLKGSLMGRELVAWSTELVYATELVNDSLGDSLQIDSANLSELISIANTLEVGIQKITPATIKITVTVPSTVYYAPFTLKFAIGSILFTNIDFVSSDDIIVLYQGTVISTFSTEGEDTSDFMNLRVDSTKTWALRNEFTESEYYSKYFKMTENAMASSVRVFSKGTVVAPVTSFNPLLADSDITQYKVRMDQDKIGSVIFGNGLWGDGINLGLESYQIIWLDLTTNTFDPTGGTLKYYAPGESVGISVTYALNSHTKSLDEDLNWIRFLIRGLVAKDSVVATKPQIRAFSNTYAAVLDSSVVRSDNITNRVTVYIKPTSVDDDVFTDIQDNLNLYGEIVTDYRVTLGAPFLFKIILATSETISSEIKSAVVAFLEAQNSYIALPYNKVLNTAEMAASLVDLTTASIVVDLQVTEILSSELKLSFGPKTGTLELVSGENIVGWDAAGLLYSKEAGVGFSFSDVLATGDFLICQFKDVNGIPVGFNVLNPVTLLNVDASPALANLIPSTFSSMIVVHTSDSYLGYAIQLKYSNNGVPTKVYEIVVYNNDSSFEDGEYSIQRYNNSLKPTVLDTVFNSTRIAQFDPKNIIVHGKELYNISIVGETFLAQKWYYSSGWQPIYYPIQATVEDGTEVMGVFEYDDDLFVITNKQLGHIVIENYQTEPVINENVELYGLGSFDETDLMSSSINNAVIKIGSQLVWLTGAPTGNAIIESKVIDYTFLQLFGSEVTPVADSFTESFNILSELPLLIRISNDTFLNSAYTVTFALSIDGTPIPDTSEHLTITEPPQSILDLYPTDRLITIIPLQNLENYELEMTVEITALGIASTIDMEFDVYESEDETSMMFLTAIPEFNKVDNVIELTGAPLRLFSDVTILATSVSVPITVKDNIFYARLKLKLGDGPYTQDICVAAFDTIEEVTDFYLVEDTVLASDSTSRIYNVKQLGTIDYPSGVIVLNNAANYKFRYKVQGSSFTLDQANYPKLDEVVWED